MRPISTQLKDMTGGVTTGGGMGFPSRGAHGQRSRLRTSSFFFFRFLHEIIFLGVCTLPSFLFLQKPFLAWLAALFETVSKKWCQVWINEKIPSPIILIYSDILV
jgi:hypothetical protein